jgi:hypothetical protein
VDLDARGDRALDRDEAVVRGGDQIQVAGGDLAPVRRGPTDLVGDNDLGNRVPVGVRIGIADIGGLAAG